MKTKKNKPASIKHHRWLVSVNGGVFEYKLNRLASDSVELVGKWIVPCVGSNVEFLKEKISGFLKDKPSFYGPFQASINMPVVDSVIANEIRQTMPGLSDAKFSFRLSVHNRKALEGVVPMSLWDALHSSPEELIESVTHGKQNPNERIRKTGRTN